MDTMIDPLRARFEGCLLGLAVGDALGWPTEFLSVAEIRARYGPAGVTDLVPTERHPAGTYTDDTQMSIAVAEALLEAGGGPLDKLMEVMAARFVAWHRAPDNDRAPGQSCSAGCERLARGVPWREAGVPDSKGCGTAMRSAPIGLYFRADEARLVEVARASALPTHGHPTACAAAVATALLVAWAVRGDDPGEFPARLVAIMRTLPEGEELATWVARVPERLARAPDEVLIRGELGEAWVGEEAVASALYCVCRTPYDFKATVLTAVNTNGDSDTIGCISGAISGALNGVSAIPPRWCETVENAAGLCDLAGRLYAAAERERR